MPKYTIEYRPIFVITGIVPMTFVNIKIPTIPYAALTGAILLALQSGVLPTLGYSVLMVLGSGVLVTLGSGVLVTLGYAVLLP